MTSSSSQVLQIYLLYKWEGFVRMVVYLNSFLLWIYLYLYFYIFIFLTFFFISPLSSLFLLRISTPQVDHIPVVSVQPHNHPHHRLTHPMRLRWNILAFIPSFFCFFLIMEKERIQPFKCRCCASAVCVSSGVCASLAVSAIALHPRFCLRGCFWRAASWLWRIQAGIMLSTWIWCVYKWSI